MKRILSLVIMVLYLLPATGMTISTHYCGGKLADVSLFGAKTKMTCSCGTGTVPEENNVLLKRKCCEEVIFSLKLENQLKEFVSYPKIQHSGVLEEIKFHFDFNRKVLNVSLKTALTYCPDLPPGRYKAPIYIQNDSFLI
ncbi:hypothetical protein [Fluviicola sp.]|jgi:hypothetical protein|uniref:HYC_CC_PP family protein n=1 Tax=Fluviicola sp. TaxID=1917219 RepID=UPI0026219349|nr:hypothetical protein [Fluviicola sp.]